MCDRKPQFRKWVPFDFPRDSFNRVPINGEEAKLPIVVCERAFLPNCLFGSINQLRYCLRVSAVRHNQYPAYTAGQRYEESSRNKKRIESPSYNLPLNARKVNTVTKYEAVSFSHNLALQLVYCWKLGWKAITYFYLL